MPVENHPDVSRQPVAVEPGEESSLIDPVEKAKGHEGPNRNGGISDNLPMMERISLGRMQNPIRGFLHGGAALASVVGLVILLVRTQGNLAAVTGALVFGLALVVMYTVSSLYHSVPWSVRWKTRLQRVDHSMIYLVVAGTCTPIAIASLDGGWLALGLGVVWAIALTGIFLKTFLPDVKTWLSVTLQLTMGWIAVLWVPRIVDELGIGAVVLILMGGAFYTVGAVMFMMKRPRLLPRSFSYHELFHVFVVIASIFHFVAVLSYAIPATV